MANFVAERVLGGKGGFVRDAYGRSVSSDPVIVKALTEFAETHAHWYDGIVTIVKDIAAKLKGLYYKKSKKDAKPQSESQELDEIYRRLVQLKDTVNTKKAAQAEGQYMSSMDEKRSWNIDWDSNDNSSIKEQLIQHLDEVNQMEPVAEVVYNKQSKKPYYTILDELLRDNFGYKINRGDFDTIIFDDNTISDLRKYINNDAEAAAAIASPYVLKRGKAISGHKNHKGKGSVSVTFAAPVILNNTIGNVAVCVTYDKGRVHSLRVLSPEGKSFELLKVKDTESTITGRSQKTTMKPYINSASNPIISNSSQKVNKKLDERLTDDDLLNAEDLIEDIKSLGGEVDQYGYVTVYHRTSQQAKGEITSTGKMKVKEDGAFFSTKANSQYTDGYGDSVVKLKMPVEMFVLDDVFDDEAHLRVPLKSKNEVLDISEYLVKSQTGQAYVSTSRHTDLHEQYKAGKITLEDYQAEMDARDKAQAAEIRKLRQQNARQKEEIQQVKDAFKNTHGGWNENKALEVLRGILKEYPTKVAATKLRPAYFELLTYIQNHPNATMDELEGKAIDLIANPILDSMKTLKNEEAQEMLADIKKMRFS